VALAACHRSPQLGAARRGPRGRVRRTGGRPSRGRRGASSVTGAAAVTAPLIIDRRFCGPPDSGNGGYVAGKLAAVVPGSPAAVTVSLRRPPPLAHPLPVRPGEIEGEVQLLDAGAVVAQATPASELPEAVPPVSEDV